MGLLVHEKRAPKLVEFFRTPSSHPFYVDEILLLSKVIEWVMFHFGGINI